MTTIFYISFAWIVFYVVHSFTATLAFKSLIKKNFPGIWKYYRLLYNLISTVTFIVAFYIQYQAFSLNQITDSIGVVILGILLFLLGLFIGYLAFKPYDVSAFLGFTPEKYSSLIQHGLNRYVRHPAYFAVILLLLSLISIIPSVEMAFFCIISLAYVYVGAKLEERKLIQEFGDDYIQYRERVKMLIPFIF